MNKMLKKLEKPCNSVKASINYYTRKLDVAKFLIKNSNLSICKTIQQHNFNLMSAHQILKQIKFFPYKIHYAN